LEARRDVRECKGRPCFDAGARCWVDVVDVDARVNRWTEKRREWRRGVERESE
jgi:hypothetical protein